MTFGPFIGGFTCWSFDGFLSPLSNIFGTIELATCLRYGSQNWFETVEKMVVLLTLLLDGSIGFLLQMTFLSMVDYE